MNTKPLGRRSRHLTLPTLTVHLAATGAATIAAAHITPWAADIPAVIGGGAAALWGIARSAETMRIDVARHLAPMFATAPRPAPAPAVSAVQSNTRRPSVTVRTPTLPCDHCVNIGLCRTFGRCIDQ